MSERKSFDAANKKARRSRKKRELALLLPVIGIILLITPIMKSFMIGSGAAHVTNTLLFIFGVWAILIVAAFVLSHTLVPEIQEK